MPKPFDLPGRFTALDGWRGLCAVLVAAYHFHTTSHFESAALIRHAYLLVDFFFVLSGFILTYAYADRLATWADACVMMWRRIGRLWPLHIAVLCAFIALELSAPTFAMLTGTTRSSGGVFDPDGSATLIGIFSNILLVHGLGVHNTLTWNFPSWSISAEVAVYGVFGVAMLAFRRAPLMAAGVLAALGFSILFTFSTRGIAVDYDLGFFRCLYGFFIGHFVYRSMGLLARGPAFATAMETACMVGLVGFIWLAGGTRWELAAPLVFGAGIVVFAGERGAVSAMLKSRPLRTLGLYSYSIYMVHALVIVTLNRAVSVLEKTTGTTLTADVVNLGQSVRALSFGNAFVMDVIVVAYLAVVIGLAAWTWRAIEIPCQAWWNARLKVGGKPKAAAPKAQIAI